MSDRIELEASSKKQALLTLQGEEMKADLEALRSRNAQLESEAVERAASQYLRGMEAYLPQAKGQGIGIGIGIGVGSGGDRDRDRDMGRVRGRGRDRGKGVTVAGQFLHSTLDEDEDEDGLGLDVSGDIEDMDKGASLHTLSLELKAVKQVSVRKVKV